MANGTFTVYLLKSPNDRNPRRLGEVKGSKEVEVIAQAVALAKRKCTPKELEGCGIEAFEYTGERRQYGFVLI